MEKVRHLHVGVVPLRGNVVLVRAETTASILSVPSDATHAWLRDLHRTFCGEYVRHQAHQCEAAIDAHQEAEKFLLDLFRKICETDHPSGQNPEIVQPMPMLENYFVVGGNINRPANNPSWNEPPPEKRRKKP